MKIENQKLNVEEAFTNFAYNIPDYQREYVWREKEVNKLLEDIYEEYTKEKSSEYFIGSIVCQKNDREIEVIDGQQRLTTLFICLCAFKKLLEQDKQYYDTIQKWLFSTKINDQGQIMESYNLILQYEDTSDLLKQILQEKEIKENLRNSAKRIYEAYQFALNYFKINLENNGKSELIKFLGYFSKKVNFIQIETPSISDALKIFETINERGVGLNPMDLLKNLVFRQLDRKDFNRLKQDWKKITTLLEKNKEKPLRFLRYFIMANYPVKIEKEVSGKKVTREVLTEDEIYDWIIENNKLCRYQEEPFVFVEKMHENAEAYVNFAKGKYKNGETHVFLRNIQELGGSLSQHLMLLLAVKDIDKEIFDYLTKEIETLLFYYVITKTPTKELELKFAKWSNEIRELNTISDSEQKTKINEFIRTRLIAEINSKEENFKIDFLRFNLYSLQRYRVKYLLAKITQYVDLMALGQKDPELLDNYLKSKIEMEHILPNNPTDELKTDFERENGENTYEAYKIRLGNLTLLEKPINIVVGRNYFDLKKEEYKKSVFRLTKSIGIIEDVGKNSSINKINRELHSFSQWNKDSIEKRQEMLFKFAKKIWLIEEMKC